MERKGLIFLLIVFSLSIVFSSCFKDSDWDKVVIPANQALVFFPTDNPLENDEKDIFVKVGEDKMFIRNRNLAWKICYLKAAFPEKDIVVEYVKIKDDGKIKLDPRFVNIK